MPMRTWFPTISITWMETSSPSMIFSPGRLVMISTGPPYLARALAYAAASRLSRKSRARTDAPSASLSTWWPVPAQTTVPAGTSAADAAKLVNSADGSPVYASEVGGRLVLSARTTGTGSAFAATGAMLSDEKVTQGQNASYTVNGGQVLSSQTNVVTDAIAGLKLTFKGTTSGAASITVSNPGVDKAAVKTTRGFLDEKEARPERHRRDERLPGRAVGRHRPYCDALAPAHRRHGHRDRHEHDDGRAARARRLHRRRDRRPHDRGRQSGLSAARRERARPGPHRQPARRPPAARRRHRHRWLRERSSPRSRATSARRARSTPASVRATRRSRRCRSR